MPDDANRRPLTLRFVEAVRIPPIGDDPRVLFEFRRIGVVPGWLQVVLVVGLFLATVFLVHAEYRTKGTSFGVAGPGFNCLINPIYEELIFRGWILGRLTRWRSPAVAIGVSSALFGLLHLRNIFWLEPGQLVRTVVYTGCVIGPVLGYAVLRCRSVWPAVILHYLNNLMYFLCH